MKFMEEFACPFDPVHAAMVVDGMVPPSGYVAFLFSSKTADPGIRYEHTCPNQFRTSDQAGGQEAA